MANISVKVGELASPLKVKSIKSGTTLAQFLKQQGITSNNILVNASKVSGDFVLRNGDLITTMGRVAGG